MTAFGSYTQASRCLLPQVAALATPLRGAFLFFSFFSFEFVVLRFRFRFRFANFEFSACRRFSKSRVV